MPTEDALILGVFCVSVYTTALQNGTCWTASGVQTRLSRSSFPWGRNSEPLGGLRSKSRGCNEAPHPYSTQCSFALKSNDFDHPPSSFPAEELLSSQFCAERIQGRDRCYDDETGKEKQYKQ